MEGHIAARRKTSHWQNTLTEAPQDVALNVPEDKRIEEELDMSKYEYILVLQTTWATPEDVHHTVEAALKVADETKLKGLIHDTSNKKAHHLFEDTHEKALTGTYT